MDQPPRSRAATYLHYVARSVFFVLLGVGGGLWLFTTYDCIVSFVKNTIYINDVFSTWEFPRADSQGYALCGAQQTFFNTIIAIIGGTYVWMNKKKWHCIPILYITTYMSVASIIAIYPPRLGVVIFPITFLVGFPCEVEDIHRSQGRLTVFFDLRPLFGIDRVK